MSKLSEAVKAHEIPRPGTTCAIKLLLDKSTPEDRTELLTYLNDRTYSADFLSNALKDIGVDVGGSSIGRHRRGACKCERTL
jgi:hypothetical protein